MACSLVNLTTWEQAEPALRTIRLQFPTAADLSEADPSSLEEVLRPLGLWRRRAIMLPRLAHAWLLSPPVSRKDVLKLPGCGRYASDTWAIFVEGDLSRGAQRRQAHLVRRAREADRQMSGMVPAMLADVERFNTEIIGITIPHHPKCITGERLTHCVEHLGEELDEFHKESLAGNVEGAVDGLLDLVYVALGRVVEMGCSPKALFDLIHEKNMQKRRGEVSKRPNSMGHDAVKPVGWTPPDLTPYLFDKDQLHAALDFMLITTADGPTPVAPPTIVADSSGFKKDDVGKDCRPELIPAEAIHALGCLYAHGAEKYDAENWRKGAAWQRYVGAIERHALRFRMGHSFDNGPGGSGAHEMIAVAWNAITLYMHDVYGMGEDNRPLAGKPLKGCP